MELEYESYRPHILYIVLQGEFVVYRERRDDAHDDILHIKGARGHGHDYKAGPWLSHWSSVSELPRTHLYLGNAFGDRKQGPTPRRSREEH